jgi:hypothetical protein
MAADLTRRRRHDRHSRVRRCTRKSRGSTFFGCDVSCHNLSGGAFFATSRCHRVAEFGSSPEPFASRDSFGDLRSFDLKQFSRLVKQSSIFPALNGSQIEPLRAVRQRTLPCSSAPNMITKVPRSKPSRRPSCEPASPITPVRLTRSSQVLWLRVNSSHATLTPRIP